MNCSEFRELGRDDAHLADCAACRAWLEAERRLDSAFAALRSGPMDGAPSAGVESAVLSAFRREAGNGKRRRWMVWAFPAAAAAMVVVGLLWNRAPTPRREVPPVARQQAVAGFIPVHYGAPVRPMETLQVMRVELPRAELVRLGLPIGPEAANGMVKADVLLGEDGLVKGIRFVYGTLELQAKGVR